MDAGFVLGLSRFNPFTHAVLGAAHPIDLVDRLVCFLSAAVLLVCVTLVAPPQYAFKRILCIMQAPSNYPGFESYAENYWYFPIANSLLYMLDLLN